MLTLLAAALTIQTATAPARNTEFDFWIGNWECEGRSRNAPGKDEWTVTKTRNTIKRTLTHVIEENFTSNGFNGRSWSVYNARRKKWNQTWVDDSGAYLTFEGEWDGKAMTLIQTFPNPAGFKARMVFSKIEKDSLRWDWQSSIDEGKTWETQWELNYKRRK